MHAPTEAREAFGAVDLSQGLGLAEVHVRLERGLRLQDTGQRVLAFYLTEMQERGLHSETSHSSAAWYAEDLLGIPRRRARELIAVGRKLLTLPAIDRAFCQQQIGWSKVLLLARVATPDHEQAWLEQALDSTWRELALQVRLHREGSAPRGPGDLRGLPSTRFRVAIDVDSLTHGKLEDAREKLSDESGKPVDSAELLDVLLDLFLSVEEDGTVPGRKRVDASLYQVMLRPADGTDADADADAPLVLETADGPAVVNPKDVPLDGATPPAMRKRVLKRDGRRCRCCGSRYRLMVHHIVYRSQGGPTRMHNLIVLCTGCHSLVHDDLLILEGPHADAIRFVDRDGRQLGAGRDRVDPTALLELVPPDPVDHAAPANGETTTAATNQELVTLDDVPDTIDATWWRRHAHLLGRQRDGRLTWVAGRPSPPPAPSEPASPAPFEKAFDGIVGQDRLLALLRTTARGSARRGKPFPHTLLVGPAGCGKTSITAAIASHVGARLVSTAGPVVRDVHTLVGLLAELGDDDMLFLDEIHAVPQSVLEVLYEAMTSGRLSLTLGAGPRTRTVKLALPRFTLLAATSEDGDLPRPLRTRFGLLECVGHYAREHLAEIATRCAGSGGFRLEPGAALRIADCARGTPREAVRLVERVLDACSSGDADADAGGHGLPDAGRIDRRTARGILHDLGFDDQGLGPVEQAYLRTLRQSPGPMSLERLARCVGHGARAIARYVEPFLMARGLVRVTPRGRVAVRPAQEAALTA